MSSPKILTLDYPSFAESKLMDYAERTYNLTEADIFVNPLDPVIMNKTVIINLPIELPIDALAENNTMISRFPINRKVNCVPYHMPKKRKEVKEDDFDMIILTPDACQDAEVMASLKGKNILIGTRETMDGEATLVGFEVAKSNIEQFESEEE